MHDYDNNFFQCVRRMLNKVITNCGLIMNLFTTRKKPHICEEGGAHIRFSFLTFIDELEKQLFIKKNGWSGSIKNKTILIFTMLHLFKKQRKIPGDIVLHMCTKNLDDMIYSAWRIEHDGLKLAIYGHFLPFNFPKTQKIKILKNSKNYLWCHQFAHVYQKSQSYDILITIPEVWSETDRIFCHFRPSFF